MSFDENKFEKLRFNSFGFDNVLLNNTNESDENIFKSFKISIRCKKVQLI